MGSRNDASDGVTGRCLRVHVGVPSRLNNWTSTLARRSPPLFHFPSTISLTSVIFAKNWKLPRPSPLGLNVAIFPKPTSAEALSPQAKEVPREGSFKDVSMQLQNPRSYGLLPKDHARLGKLPDCLCKVNHFAEIAFLKSIPQTNSAIIVHQ